MLKLEEYAARDGLGLKELLDRREISAGELCETAISAIEALNPQLNFLIAWSREEAERAVKGFNPRQPFSGVPVLVKEGVGMAGQPAYIGCRLAEGLLCQEDSEFVRRLKKTGVVILGSTNAPEIGNSATTEPVLHGPARNPWKLDHSTGGSSGGSSAAVAAGVVPIASSSDGGGSIRIPAHCCGVFGLAPSRGRNPVGPNINGGPWGFLRNHVATRSVRDSAAMLDHLHGTEPGALHRVAPPARSYLEEAGTDPGRLRIAFSIDSPSGEVVHPECAKAVLKMVKFCEELGHEVEEATPRLDWHEFSQAFADYWAFTTARTITVLEQASGRVAGPDTLEYSTLALLRRSRTLTSERLAKSWESLHRFNREFDTFISGWHLLITPVCLTPAPALGVLNGHMQGLTFEDWIDQSSAKFGAFTPQLNVSGHPAMSVPIHHSRDGLPVGVQCVARHGDEATLFRLAGQLEQACPWAHRRPPFTEANETAVK